MNIIFNIVSQDICPIVTIDIKTIRHNIFDNSIDVFLIFYILTCIDSHIYV